MVNFALAVVVDDNGHPVAARRLDLELAPYAVKLRFTNCRHNILFRLAKGSFPLLFEFALAELAGVKLPGPLARIDGLLTAMRTSPRPLHDCKGGQRPVWVHSSSVADRSPRPPSSKSVARIITAAFLIRQNACFFRSELAQDRASDAQEALGRKTHLNPPAIPVVSVKIRGSNLCLTGQNDDRRRKGLRSSFQPPRPTRQKYKLDANKIISRDEHEMVQRGLISRPFTAGAAATAAFSFAITS